MKMNIKDLRVGDFVFIRLDLEHGTRYGEYVYFNNMGKGLQQLKRVYWNTGNFTLFNKGCYFYTPEMVDWDKTMHFKLIADFSGVGGLHTTDMGRSNTININELDTKRAAKEYLNEKFGNHDIVNSPSHYNGGGKHNIECYKAIEYILERLENVPEKYFGHVSNIVKYVWRCNDKNGYEDLDKASVYLDFMFREED